MDDSEKAAIYRFHAEFCQCLADASRLMIITELENSEISVNELAQRLDIPQASVSKHLAIMRQRGLVTTRRQGTAVFYALSDSRICQAISLMKQVQAEQADHRHDLAQRSTDL